LESIAAAREAGGWPRVLPADWPLSHLPRVFFDASQVARLMHGQAVAVPAEAGIGAAARIRLYDEGGRFLGIGESDGGGSIQPRRLFVL
jgi:tRNA U55 pseudouridine synthase TruB